MTERRFDIVFDGNIIDGTNLPDVKSNLQSLFKLDDKEIARLFSGQPVIIKKNLDRQTASQYQKAITQAGAKIQLILHQPETQHSKDNPVSNDEGITLLPQSGDILSEEEKNTVEPRVIDTSHLTLDIQEQEESSNPFLANLNESPIDSMSNSEITIHNEIKPNDHIQLETSLTVATAGETLSTNTHTSPSDTAPNVDHLTAIDVGEPLLNDEERAHLRKNNQVVIAETENLSLADAGNALLEEHERENQEPVEVDTSGLTVLKTD